MCFGVESDNSSHPGCVHHIIEFPEGVALKVLACEEVSGGPRKRKIKQTHLPTKKDFRQGKRSFFHLNHRLFTIVAQVREEWRRNLFLCGQAR